jgi:hypothetical protein
MAALRALEQLEEQPDLFRLRHIRMTISNQWSDSNIRTRSQRALLRMLEVKGPPANITIQWS